MNSSIRISVLLSTSLVLTQASIAAELRYELVSIVSPTNVSGSTIGNVDLREVNGALVAIGSYESVTGGGTLLRPLVWTLSGSFGLAAGTGTDISALGPFQFGGRLNDINESGGIAAGRYDSSANEQGLELQLAAGPSATSNIWSATGASVALGINDNSPALTVGSRRIANCSFSNGQFTAVSHTFMSTGAVTDLVDGGLNYNTAVAVQTAASPVAVGDTDMCGTLSECDPTWGAASWTGSSLSFYAEGATDAYSRAENINNAGEVVGAVRYEQFGACRPRAVIWDSLSSFLELGPMLPGSSPGGTYSLKTYAADLSNAECGRQFVVGRETISSRAVAWWRCEESWQAIWIDQSLSPLQTGVGSMDYRVANGVNDAGWVVGRGVEFSSGLSRGFVLKPIKCPSDLDGSGIVDSTDLALFLGQWGCEASPGSTCWRFDLSADGAVGAPDMAILLGAWGACPCQCGDGSEAAEGQSAQSNSGAEPFDAAAVVGFTSEQDFIWWATQLSPEQMESLATLLRSYLQGDM